MLLSKYVCLLFIFSTILSSSIILNKSGNRGCFCFLFHLKRNTFSHSPLNIMLTGFSIDSFISLRQFFSFLFSKLKFFIINVCWIFQVFFAFIEIFTDYFSFVLLLLELHHLNFECETNFIFIGWTQLGPDGLSFFKEKYI